ncbi:MAG: nuclear transport factor 2 family protein [Crenarchaeota archaeon]|nr:nuclear transport factor 2 family protein [Thermoproteota archaeon]
MKADQITQLEVTQSLKGMFEAYKKKDFKGVISFWAPDSDATMIGSGKDEKNIGFNQFKISLKRDWAQADITSIGVKDFRVSAAGVVAWFSADLTFNFKTDDKEVSLPGRLTGVMEKRNNKWLWVQMHYSTPNSKQEQGRS